MKYRGGAARNRTGVNGFADHRVTSPPQHRGAFEVVKTFSLEDHNAVFQRPRER